MYAFELAGGLALVAVVLYDVFETVVVPRRTDAKWRLSPPMILLLWPLWLRFGVRRHPDWRREEFLGTFAPFVIMLVMVFWVVALVLGFGLALHARADDFDPPLENYGTAAYVAGVSLLTIGFGDIVPTGALARVMTLLAGASGLAVVALVISMTFNLYGSFARREVMVLLLDARTGSPPSGVLLLEAYAERQVEGRLAELFARYETWTAELLDSHLAYPILPYFRSSHDRQSWVSTLGAVLDAATLLLTAVERPGPEGSDACRASRAAAEWMYEIGCHALVDLTMLRPAKKMHFVRQPGIERGEFDAACAQLGRAGYEIAADREAAWQAFSEHRALYAGRLNAAAQYLASPPTLWIGDRTILAQRRRQHLEQ